MKRLLYSGNDHDGDDVVNYERLRELLFLLDPETSHHLSLEGLKYLERVCLTGWLARKVPAVPVRAMGLQFPNPVGLAAGLDKNGDYIDALGALGFGFIEIGTITPKSQPGNPKPRLFRLPEHQAIINRMGFNNKGVDHLVKQVAHRRYQGILGINIGKNAVTPVEEAIRDYLYCLDRVYEHADYVTANLSSPNTPGLRTLQLGDALKSLVNGLADRKAQLATVHGKRVPLLIKIAPDMTPDEVHHLAQVALECEVDGLIATNTTLAREQVKDSVHADEAGGLSGKPVFATSTAVLAQLAAETAGKLCLVGVGGIDNAASAQAKLDAGASLLQVYTGFIYRGPELIAELVAACQAKR